MPIANPTQCKQPARDAFQAPNDSVALPQMSSASAVTGREVWDDFPASGGVIPPLDTVILSLTERRVLQGLIYILRRNLFFARGLHRM